MQDILNFSSVIAAAFEAASKCKSTVDAARVYYEAGLRAVPALGKVAQGVGWGMKDHDPADFRGKNVALCAGKNGGGIVAFDFDCDESVEAFRSLGVKTLLCGRNGQVRRAVFLSSTECGHKLTLQTKSKVMLLELLTGRAVAQISFVVPPSIWVSDDGREKQSVEIIGDAVPPLVLPYDEIESLWLKVRAITASAYGLSAVPSERVTGPSHAVERADTGDMSMKVWAQRAVDRVRRAQEGGRNCTLYRESCYLGTLDRYGFSVGDQIRQLYELLPLIEQPEGTIRSGLGCIEDENRALNDIVEMRSRVKTGPGEKSATEYKGDPCMMFNKPNTSRILTAGSEQSLYMAIKEDIGTIVMAQDEGFVWDDSALLWRRFHRDQLHSYAIQYKDCEAINKKGEIIANSMRESLVRASVGLLVKDREIYDREWLKHGPSGVPLLNGWLNLDGTIGPIGKHHRSTHVMPFRYEKGAISVKFNKFLDEVFAADKIDPVDAQNKKSLIKSFIGVCILGKATKFQKALVFYGPKGANGKSVLINVFEYLFTEDSRSCVSPSKFENEYYLGGLIGSRINLVPEMPTARQIEESQALKSIIDGSEIQARKPRGEPVDFKPIAGHIFNTNELFKSADSTDAFYRRFIVISFPNTFIGKENTGLSEDLRKDASAIFSECLDLGLKALKADKLVEPQSSKDLIEGWKEDNNHAEAFVKRTYQKAPPEDFNISAQDVLNEYQLWCASNCVDRLPNQSIFNAIKHCGYAKKKVGRAIYYNMNIVSSDKKSS